MVNSLRTKRIMAFGDNDSRDGGHHVASSTNYKMRPPRSKWNRVVRNANSDKGRRHMASQPKRRIRKRKLRRTMTMLKILKPSKKYRRTKCKMISYN